MEVGAPKQRAVLAALLVNANEPVHMENLIDAVWWKPPPATPVPLEVSISAWRGVAAALKERVQMPPVPVWSDFHATVNSPV